MAIGDWSAETLNVDADCIAKESSFLQWVEGRGGGELWRGEAKKEIELKLRHALKDIEIATDEDEVLDLLENPEVLNLSATLLTLHLTALSKVVSPGDYWDRKAEIYMSRFKDEWPIAAGLIHVDTDESGDISDSEKYNFPTGVRLTRGGP